VRGQLGNRHYTRSSTYRELLCSRRAGSNGPSSRLIGGVVHSSHTRSSADPTMRTEHQAKTTEKATQV